MNTQVGDRAVVIGASMAGLLAAHVLADSYGEVMVIDRDDLPTTPMHRRSVSHGRHLHALAGQRAASLGGTTPRPHRRPGHVGAPAGDLLDNARLYLSGHRLRQAHSGLVLLCASRPLLEGQVRARIRAHPNVRLVDRCDVVGLLTTPDGHRVTGARVLRHADGSAEELVDADLVVDASGRGSRTAAWLEALGHPRPESDRVQIGLGYATQTFRLPPDVLDGDLAALIAATPRHPRTGAIQRLEGDRWMVTLGGILGDHPSTNPEGFLEFARSLQFPDIHDAIHDAGPLDAVVAFRFPASVRHRYERQRYPAGVLVMGARSAASTRSTAKA